MHRLAHRPFLRPATGATRSPLRRAAALCAELVSLSAAAARAQVTHCLPADPVWTWANPLPHGQALTQTRWVPEISAFVAVGDAAMSSPDGAAWTRLHGFPPDMMRDFWWNGTTAVAVGEDPTGFFGALYVSTDFTTWTPRTLPEVVNWGAFQRCSASRGTDPPGSPSGSSARSIPARTRRPGPCRAPARRTTCSA